MIIGGGGHGLATVYYLAKQFGAARIAVLEKGWIGGGNVGRNTTIIRSNDLLEGNGPFYEFALKLWEKLEQDLNYNAMISQRDHFWPGPLLLQPVAQRRIGVWWRSGHV